MDDSTIVESADKVLQNGGGTFVRLPVLARALNRADKRTGEQALWAKNRLLRLVMREVEGKSLERDYTNGYLQIEVAGRPFIIDARKRIAHPSKVSVPAVKTNESAEE